MILIAENSKEDHLILGLESLLRDLQVDACGFRSKEAIAPIFWSAEDIFIDVPSIKDVSNEDISAILSSMEPDLLEAMILAGFEVIERYMKDTKGVVVFQQHRNLQ